VTFDLHAGARNALRAYDLAPDLPADAARQLATLQARTPEIPDTPAADLRELLWSSIDDDRSRDLDQIEVADTVPGGTRVRVGVADVDTLVGKGSPLDQSASRNATTVYTGVDTFPMLPVELSTDRTSLAPGQDRWALVVEYTVAPDGSTTGGSIYRAVVRNQAQLAYDGVGAWLAGTGKPPGPVATSAALAAQLQLQWAAAKCLRQARAKRGALDLETIEAAPVVDDGQVTDLRAVRPGPARDIIEDFMIAANAEIATFLDARGRTAIRRVVRAPVRWPRLVELARTYGTALPAAPDGRALAAFLAARRVADPVRFPDLSLAVIKLLGRVRDRVAGWITDRAFRARRARLHPRDGSQPALRGPGDGTIAEGGNQRGTGALHRCGTVGHRRTLHRAGGQCAARGSPGPQGGRSGAARSEGR